MRVFDGVPQFLQFLKSGNTFCGKDNPAPFISKAENVYISFKSDQYDTRNQGFKLEYHQYNKDDKGIIDKINKIKKINP